MSILENRTKERLAPHTLQDQLIAKVEHLLKERRTRNERVMVERRGLNPQRKGWEDQSDVVTAFNADKTYGATK